jgi:hypothetical protein
VRKIALRGRCNLARQGDFAHAAGLPWHNPAMSRYRRPKIEGGIFFFTVVLADRSSELLVKHIEHLRQVYPAVQARLPFETNAICTLPDHLHLDAAARGRRFCLTLEPNQKRVFPQASCGAIEVQEPDAKTRNGNLATTVLGACNSRRR